MRENRTHVDSRNASNKLYVYMVNFESGINIFFRLINNFSVFACAGILLSLM